ncbi:MAG TPA: CDP-alcohol phosphatidyltransferase family protein [Steroidobacteraceae bacterium]|nr:CDP-alcohol phosphatidyltransferase family protein [Steroidobacteraceae bacterium]
MSDSFLAPVSHPQRPWDARLARWLVTPLARSRVTPNHLTTIRLATGLAGAVAFTSGTYGWCNVAALLVILSNFLDHTDGELARLSGKMSRIGHVYDLASDAAVTVLLFVAMGVGIGTASDTPLGVSPPAMGAVAGAAVALIFYLRMRIEEMAGKVATRQPSLSGFEAEDILYLLPLVTLLNGVMPFLVAASIGAPVFAAWVVIDHRRVARRSKSMAASPTSGTGLV